MKKIKLENLIFLCLITTIIVVSLSLSKYQSTTAGESQTEVAKLAITLSSNTLNIKMSPTQNIQEYIFSVSNTEDNSNSEVSMKYTLQVKTLQNLPLKFELYTYENDVEGTENLFENTGSITNKEIVIDFNENIINTYKLKIIWEEDKKNYEFSNVIEHIQIILNSSQVD